MAKVVLSLASDELYYHFPTDLYEWLTQRFPDHYFVYVSGDGQAAEEIEDADVFWGWTITPDLLRRARQLKWVMFAQDNVRELLQPELVGMDTIVTNSGGVRAQAVAEHAIAMILAHARSMGVSHRFQEARKWDSTFFVRQNPLPFELAGRRAVVVGYGSVGSQIGRIAKVGFGMTVLAVRHNASLPCEHADQVYEPSLLPQAVHDADFVILALPGTARTEKLVGNAVFAAMAPQTYLVNVGHGSVLDLYALIATLKHRRIAGAALDTIPDEPIDADHPVWDLDNVIITPHYAGVTPNLWSHMVQLFAENLELFLARQPLLNQIDFKLGY